MSLRYLLDINIISESLKQVPSLNVLRLIREKESETAICSPVWHEIVFGMKRIPTSR